MQPIQLQMYSSVFTASAFAGIASQIESYFASIAIYGIDAGVRFKRGVGVRVDLKTLMSWGNVNSISLIGDF